MTLSERPIMRHLILSGLFLLFCAHCQAQTDQRLRFYAASVKPMTPTPGSFLPYTGGPNGADPGRVSYGQATLRTLVADAYGLRNPRDISGPDWLDDTWYSVTATCPPNTTLDQYRQVLANLLADRFELVFHRQSKPVTGYEMTVAPTGLKISSTNGADPAAAATAGAGRKCRPKPLPGSRARHHVLYGARRRHDPNELPASHDGTSREPAQRTYVQEFRGASGRYRVGHHYRQDRTER